MLKLSAKHPSQTQTHETEQNIWSSHLLSPYTKPLIKVLPKFSFTYLWKKCYYSMFKTWWHTRRNQIWSSAKRTSPFKSAGVSVQSTAGGRGVRISGQQLYRPCSDLQCKTTGYPLHSHLSPSFPLPCVTVCHQVLNTLYHKWNNPPENKILSFTKIIFISWLHSVLSYIF